ncbi:MAG: hypothetical protein H7101_13605 [Deinococcales bacterium]|nr:hypothetical protein [Chitinophagaceae bacterium]
MAQTILEDLKLQKASAQKALENLPENFSAADLLEQVIMEEDIKSSLSDIKNGNLYTHGDMLKMIESWSA